MTENMKMAIEAVNKWLYFGWNYPVIYHEHTNPSTDAVWCDNVPKFLVDIKWNCNFHHIYLKWKEACESKNSDAYLTSFYKMLSSDNRAKLIDYVMHNFNDEIKIIHE